MAVAEPVLTPPDGGPSIQSPGGSACEIKVDSGASAGEYGVVRYVVAAGEEPPMHTHSREDELVYVLEGEITARVGDAAVDVGPGAFAALPRGVPHTVAVKGPRAVLLLTFVPGGLEHFFVPSEGPPDPGAFGLTFADAA